jgi:hypothetical protein
MLAPERSSIKPFMGVVCAPSIAGRSGMRWDSFCFRLVSCAAGNSPAMADTAVKTDKDKAATRPGDRKRMKDFLRMRQARG